MRKHLHCVQSRRTTKWRRYSLFWEKCMSFHLNTPAIRLARLFVRHYRVGCDASDSSLLLQHTPRVAPPLASVGDKVAGRTRHSAPAAGRLAAFRSEISK